MNLWYDTLRVLKPDNMDAVMLTLVSKTPDPMWLTGRIKDVTVRTKHGVKAHYSVCFHSMNSLAFWADWRDGEWVIRDIDNVLTRCEAL